METEFTPVMSALGGVLIGGSAVMLMLFLGRIMGATGVLAGLLSPASREDFTWRAAVVAGMITGPLIMLALTGSFPAVQVPITMPMLIVGGFIVGMGVTFGSGCTSGHGVCGMARLSPRSIAATITFMISCGMTVYLIRHVFGG